MTDTISIGILFTVIGGFIGLAGWLSNRDKRTKEDSEWRGRVDAKLDVVCGINKDVEAIQCDVKVLGERVAKVEASASSAHHRMDRLDKTT